MGSSAGTPDKIRWLVIWMSLRRWSRLTLGPPNLVIVVSRFLLPGNPSSIPHGQQTHAEPLFVKDGVTTTLPRLSLGNLGGADRYNEDYVRNLAFDHPACLPIAETDSAYHNAVPVCKELSTPEALLHRADGSVHAQVALPPSDPHPPTRAPRELGY